MKRGHIILIIAGALILIGALILFITVPSKPQITGQVVSSPVSQVKGEGGCLGEGLVSPATAQGIWCCEGLEEKIAIPYSTTEERCQGELSDPKKIACINCGDGICEITEKCLCPQDCEGQEI